MTKQIKTRIGTGRKIHRADKGCATTHCGLGRRSYQSQVGESVQVTCENCMTFSDRAALEAEAPASTPTERLVAAAELVLNGWCGGNDVIAGSRLSNLSDALDALTNVED